MKIPPKRRKTALSSLKAIARRLRLPRVTVKPNGAIHR